jgi:hypothetical protein
MQLKKNTPVAGALTALTAALLGTSPGAAATAVGRGDASLLLYTESNRITAVEGVFGFNKILKNGYIADLRLTLDGLTGASPMGATPSRKAQTFTRPSGMGTFTIAPGEIPLDPTFKDRRIAGDAGLSIPLDRLTTVTFGAHLSLEQDYSSIGLNTGLTRDFNQKNTTLGIAGSYSHDVTSPIGGPPTPFASMQVPQSNDGESEDEGLPRVGKPKNVYDVVLTATQIIDRRTLIRANYSFGRTSGYQTDPYKLLSLVEPAGSVNAGEPVEYLYEGRPSVRNRRAVYAEARRFVAGHVIDLSYRHYRDDWGIRSGTVDLSLRMKLSATKALVPHVRWYGQSAADFYRPFLVQGVAHPDYASADSRLAKFTAMTFGLKYLFPVAVGTHMSVAAEYYTQHGDRSPPEAFGTLRSYNLFPTMKAYTLRLGFERGF